MKRRMMRITAWTLSAGMVFSWAGTPVLASEENLTGTLAFAQCDDYVNVRSEANTDGEPTGKLYHNNAVTIVGQEGDWYQITSGNVSGYVKADYFATGAQAEEIAEKVAYNVAKVHPETLNVRMTPDEESDILDTAQQAEELEVVDWNGDWMKVALNENTYGYVNAYYVDYKTYYAVGETLEEEQHRIQQMQAAAQATEIKTPEPEWTETPETEWTETPETEWTETPGTEWTEAPETEWTEAPETEWTEAPETEWTEAPETEWTEAPETEWTEAPETEWTEAPETEWTEAPETEWTEAPETEWTEAPETEPTVNSDRGQQIADFAVQFVGNPYVYGGTSLTDGADCSGFTQSVMANFGIYISRTAESQSYGGTPVDLGNLQPGDLVFYSNGGYIGHVALYIGGGQVVHASTPESGIIISNYDYNTPVSASRYW